MPGVMSLRPMAATGNSRLVEERERVSTVKAGVQQKQKQKQQQMNMNMPGAPGMSNPQIARAKQVTDPWPTNVRARLVGSDMEKSENYSSSGSEHEPSSNCLAAMVHEFMEVETVDVPMKNGCGRARCNCESGSCNGDAPAPDVDVDAKSSSLGGELAEVLHGLAPCASAEETRLLGEVIAALDTGADHGRRAVVKHLRARGYNAALCKSRWDHAGSFPGGDYDYIDVVDVVESPSSRLIVDIEFQSQFEIARPSTQYKHAYQALPAVFVGSSDRLLQIINLMSEAVKRSLKKKGMLLPPWRKPEYVKAKWFSTYKRTTNEAASSQRKPPNISLVAVRTTDWDKTFTQEMEHFIDNTDWELPALLPKALNRRTTGLTSMLREAGLIGAM